MSDEGIDVQFEVIMTNTSVVMGFNCVDAQGIKLHKGS